MNTEPKEYLFDAKACQMFIKGWQRRFMRKNSKYPAVIKLSCYCPSLDSRDWKYWIVLVVNSKEVDKSPIRPETYDSLSYDTKLKRENHSNFESITLFDTTPKFTGL